MGQSVYTPCDYCALRDHIAVVVSNCGSFTNTERIVFPLSWNDVNYMAYLDHYDYFSIIIVVHL